MGGLKTALFLTIKLILIRFLLVLIFFFITFASRTQDLVLGDYIPGNGLTFASSDDNYKVVIRGYAQSLFEYKANISLICAYSQRQ